MDAPTSGLHCLKTWVEEPLANMIALCYLASIGPSRTNENSRMDFVTAFVQSQPENYALGLNLFRASRLFDWEAWKNAKWLLCFKIDALLDWMEYVKGNLANVDVRCLKDLFREIVRQPIEFNQTLLQQAEVTSYFTTVITSTTKIIGGVSGTIISSSGVASFEASS